MFFNEETRRMHHLSYINKGTPEGINVAQFKYE
jgi:hypothetical protein